MDNPRPEKVAIVDEVKDRLDGASAVMVTEYRGLTVAALSELRGTLREAGGSYKVYKNTLVRRAAVDVGEEFTELLVGPTALAFTETKPDGEPGDVAAVAKALKEFAKANPDLIVKGGLFDGSFIDADGLKALADIEPREVLLAKLAGAIAAPMTQMAGLLQALPRDLAYGIKALIDMGGAPGAPADAPAEAPSADEAPDAALEAADADSSGDADPSTDDAAPEAAAEAPADAEADAVDTPADDSAETSE